jgi:phage terminase small subunit
MSTMQPPANLSRRARKAWRQIHKFHSERGTWSEKLAPLVAMAAGACDIYMEIAVMLRNHKPAEEIYSRIATGADSSRHFARASLVGCGCMPAEDALAFPVNAEGLDADIAGLCA